MTAPSFREVTTPEDRTNGTRVLVIHDAASERCLHIAVRLEENQRLYDERPEHLPKPDIVAFNGSLADYFIEAAVLLNRARPFQSLPISNLPSPISPQ